MKRTVLFLVVLAILIYAFALFYNRANSGIKNYGSLNSGGVVAFGDSLTYGTGSVEGGGYVKMLTEDLKIPIANLGVRGDTTIDALNRIEQVTSRRPRITIVLLGGNDFLKGLPQEDTFQNLGMIIERIEASGSAVILVGIQPVIAKNHERESFDKLAKTYRTAYVPDILHGIYGNLNLMSDNLHPNDAGYKIMASRIEPVLKSLLK